jgi:hypothetical protein
MMGFEKFNTGWAAMGFKSYQEYLDSWLWKDRKEAFLLMKKDNLYCEMCGETKGLNVHHKHYESVCNETAKDMILLCKKCHLGRHNGLQC